MQIGWSILGNVVLLHGAGSHWNVVLVDEEAPIVPTDVKKREI